MPIRTWAVGLFIVGGLGLLTGLLFIIGARQHAFETHIDFQTRFSDLSGLATGTKVRVSGIDSGKIKSIRVPNSSAEKFLLDLEVEEKVHPMIHTDSVVSIETDGVVGDKFVLIRRGGDQSEIAPAGTVLPSKEPLDISAMMDQASGLLKDVHKTMSDVQGRVDGALDAITTTINHADGLITQVGPQVQKIARDGGRITGNIDTLVADLNAGKGPAGMLLRDEETKRQIQTTLANVQQSSANLNDASSRADQVIGDFQSRQLVQKAQVTLDNVQAISQQLSTTLNDAFAEDSMGVKASENLRETLSSLNRTTTNLAEDTEALKHNFFLRGFFKRRGFFSLNQITPTDYRQAFDRGKHAAAGTRLWLQAYNLMVTAPDGKEELSAAGRSQVDAVIAPVLNQLPGSLIVVEGYAPEGSPTQQFTIARRRASSIRQYLEARYHLNHSNLGIVPLGSTPPANSEHLTWDGAAIMLLEAKSK